MTTPLKPFIKQFKRQYPKASLTASLISINDGQYVVRAAIRQDNQEIASGLAASVDVQIAEDKAQERAISLLALEVSSEVSSEVSNEVASEAAIATDSSPAVSSPAVVETDIAEKRLAPQPMTTPNQPAVNPAVKSAPKTLTADAEVSITEVPSEISLDDDDDLGPPIDSVKEEVPSPLEVQAEAQPSVATIALENFNTSDTPVDLSDVIAQTDVELTRLGWTSAQGREYLEKTYGKRSRQQLTDEELMSFLLYLEDIS